MTTSLLGAGLLLQSGVFQRDGELVPGPGLDAARPATVPATASTTAATAAGSRSSCPTRRPGGGWRSLPEMASLPAAYAPLRGGPGDAVARRAEAVLEAAFATAPGGRLGRPGSGPWACSAELIEPLDRDGFRRAVLDDPVNRQLGRVVSYPTADWGQFEQIGPLLRCGPEAGAGPRLMLPGVGEHTVEILGELGFTAAETDALLAAKVARQLEG